MSAMLASVASLFDTVAHTTTVFQPPALLSVFETLGSSLGFPADQVRYLTGMVLAYPLALLDSRLPSAQLRHVYGLVAGVIVAQAVLGPAWLHAAVSSTLVYLSMRLAPKQHAPLISFAVSLIYLTASHIYRQYHDYMGWTLDYTGPQMLLTIKISSLAYDLYDGTTDFKRLEQVAADESNKGCKVAQGRLSRCVRRFPTPLEFFAFVFHYSSFLAGPAISFRHYNDTVNATVYTTRDGKATRQVPGGRLQRALLQFLSGVACLAVYVVLSPYFSLNSLLSDELKSAPLYKYVAVWWLTTITTRFRYYFGWLVAEGATVLGGFGFAGWSASGKPQWTAANNVEVVSFELASTTRTCARAWNKHTQAWLQHYVYERATVSPLAATYFISAFWHGFYPGYYLFFLSMPLITAVNRLTYKRVRPLFSLPSTAALRPPYHVACIVVTSITMNYLVAPFLLLSWERGIAVWTHVYFGVHILAIALLFALRAMPGAAKPAKGGKAD